MLMIIQSLNIQNKTRNINKRKIIIGMKTRRNWWIWKLCINL